MDSARLGLFHVTRPPPGDGLGPHPCLLLLHGRGADELDLLGLAEELDPRLFVVSARAPLRMGPGYAWYHLQNIGEPEPASFQASLAALSTFVADLPQAYPVDTARIFVLGFSQGAMMAGSLLLTRPSHLAGTAMLSGYLPLNSGLAVDEAPLRNRPAFVAHGTGDQVLPVALGRQARDYLVRLGADVTYREYRIGHSIGPDELVELAGWLGDRIG
jgi:phospholipase/carboxylesterase